MNIGKTGSKGENMVARFLQKQGCTLLKRNHSCRFGEVDIIAQKDSLLLFIEVKTRKENALVTGAQSVDSRKQERIRLTAEDYIQKTEAVQSLQPRFDVAEVTVSDSLPAEYKLNYIKNAF